MAIQSAAAGDKSLEFFIFKMYNAHVPHCYWSRADLGPILNQYEKKTLGMPDILGCHPAQILIIKIWNIHYEIDPVLREI